jgi:hypothetical protein
MRRVSNFFYRISTGWVTLIALLIFIVFTATVLPAQSAQAGEASQGAGTPDLSFTYYSANTLYNWAEAYGEAGRQAYVRARFTFDVAWPLVYTTFLVTATSWLFARGYPPGSSWRLANLTPLIGMLFDFMENISTSLVIARYPAETPVVASLAGVFTLLKWLFVIGSMLVLVFGAVAALMARRKERKPQPDG